jgi:hypothetical protein
MRAWSYVVRFVGIPLLAVVGCATGTIATDEDGGGNGVDSGNTGKDSGTTRPDTGTTQKDSGGTQPDTGSTPPCGGTCLGTASTCCSNMCVDTTSDPNNCGACGTPCGTESCCSSSCVDTMGSDVNNCGGCGVTCAGTCTMGVCQMSTGSCTEDLGSCSHSVCVAGSALVDGCDVSEDDITDCVCLFFDPTCCTTSWTSSCVTEAVVFCGEPCTDPGC